MQTEQWGNGSEGRTASSMRTQDRSSKLGYRLPKKPPQITDDTSIEDVVADVCSIHPLCTLMHRYTHTHPHSMHTYSHTHRPDIHTSMQDWEWLTLQSERAFEAKQKKRKNHGHLPSKRVAENLKEYFPMDKFSCFVPRAVLEAIVDDKIKYSDDYDIIVDRCYAAVVCTHT